MEKNDKVQKAGVENYDPAAVEAALVGDLSKLSPQQCVNLIMGLCRKTGLDPLTKPFEFIVTWDARKKAERKILYATKNASEQLSRIHNLVVAIVEKEIVTTPCGEQILTLRSTCKSPDGRQSENVAAVSLSTVVKNSDGTVALVIPLTGREYSVAYMRAHTMAMRRVVLTHTGISVPDETEIDNIEGARKVETPLPPQATQATPTVTEAEAEIQDAEEVVENPALTTVEADAKRFGEDADGRRKVIERFATLYAKYVALGGSKIKAYNAEWRVKDYAEASSYIEEQVAKKGAKNAKS